MSEYVDFPLLPRNDRVAMPERPMYPNSIVDGLRSLFPDGSEDWCLNCRHAVKTELKEFCKSPSVICCECGLLIEEVAGDNIVAAVMPVLWPTSPSPPE